MATCAKCGAALPENANFCASCGARTGAGSGADRFDVSAGEPEIPFNVAALLCYLLWPVACALCLLLNPYRRDKLVRFHAYQALYLGLFAIVLGVALKIPTTILNLIPVLGLVLNFLVWTAYGLGILGLAVFAMYKAYQRELYRIPWVGKLAAQRANKAL